MGQRLEALEKYLRRLSVKPKLMQCPCVLKRLHLKELVAKVKAANLPLAADPRTDNRPKTPTASVVPARQTSQPSAAGSAVPAARNAVVRSKPAAPPAPISRQSSGNSVSEEDRTSPTRMHRPPVRPAAVPTRLGSSTATATVTRPAVAVTVAAEPHSNTTALPVSASPAPRSSPPLSRRAAPAAAAVVAAAKGPSPDAPDTPSAGSAVESPPTARRAAGNEPQPEELAVKAVHSSPPPARPAPATHAQPRPATASGSAPAPAVAASLTSPANAKASTASVDKQPSQAPPHEQESVYEEIESTTASHATISASRDLGAALLAAAPSSPLFTQKHYAATTGTAVHVSVGANTAPGVLAAAPSSPDRKSVV